MTTPFEAAHRLAPQPTTRDTADRNAWIRHYAAQSLAANATLIAECRNLPPTPQPGSRPDIGYLGMLAQASMAAALAFIDPMEAPTLLWDLTPEAGALNGEWEEWLTEVLVAHGINPGHIDPAYDANDFTEALARLNPDAPYVCPTCGHTAYLHFPDCAAASTAAEVKP